MSPPSDRARPGARANSCRAGACASSQRHHRGRAQAPAVPARRRRRVRPSVEAAAAPGGDGEDDVVLPSQEEGDLLLANLEAIAAEPCAARCVERS